MNPFRLDALITCYENLRLESVEDLAGYYAEDAYFKDPFNEVRGRAAILRIFTHMFSQVSEPRFAIVERVVDEHGAMLVWEFYYRAKLWGRGATQVMRGASHLKFNSEGKVIWHRDYWDAAEELYAKLPVIGWLMRRLKKMMAS